MRYRLKEESPIEAASSGWAKRYGAPFDRPAPQRMPSCSTSVALVSMVPRNSWVLTHKTGRFSQYIPGAAVTPPYPAWPLTNAALLSVALLLMRYHEAVIGFDFS